MTELEFLRRAAEFGGFHYARDKGHRPMCEAQAQPMDVRGYAWVNGYPDQDSNQGGYLDFTANISESGRIRLAELEAEAAGSS